jgi:hypothetical protein
MLTRNRWREMLLSLAAGQAMVPLGDNRKVVRQLSERIWALRAADAAKRAAPAPPRCSSRCV